MSSPYKNIFDYEQAAIKNLSQDAYEYLAGGADDKVTLKRNNTAFSKIQLVPRRLVDVSSVDLGISLFGNEYTSPIVLSPVGMQKLFHPEGAMATAEAAQSSNHLMIVSTVTNNSYASIAKGMNPKPWFQLYTTTKIEVTKELILTAESNGCEVLVLTVDVPVVGNREKHAKMLVDNVGGRAMGIENLAGKLGDEDHFHNPALTWEIIPWIKKHCKMKIILKGILSTKDAAMCLQYKTDGIIVSNHGGRQLESGLSTLEALSDISPILDSKIPILLDGGIRRGTDVLKALALGATAVCIGRPYIYGLATAGATGVSDVLNILDAELKRNMQLCGISNLEKIDGSYLRFPKW